MKILGIKLVPLCVPLEERLQALAAGGVFFLFIFGGLVTLSISFYILFYTRFWLPMLLYLIWIWFIDNKSSENGSKVIYESMRGLKWWTYVRDYFPAKLISVPGVELDKTKNYMFCCFPHGVITYSVFSAFGTSIGGFKKLFPHHTTYIVTLPLHFYMPFTRDFGLSLGVVSNSGESLNQMLSSPNGGNVAVVTVGGASESLKCRPGEYRLNLKYKKGFIKYALRNGSPLVPVFLFGENEIYDQVSNPKGSLLRKFQDTVKHVLGFAPIIPKGRGLFQYSFGIIPFKKPLTTVVGKPIDVVKIEKPSGEDIDKLHRRFIECLVNLFEENKHKYIKNADKAEIIIE